MRNTPAFISRIFERIRTHSWARWPATRRHRPYRHEAFNQLVVHDTPPLARQWNGGDAQQITLAMCWLLRREYSPSQVILTIVGDVTLEQATALVQTH